MLGILWACDQERIHQDILPEVRFPDRILYLNNPSLLNMRVSGSAMLIEGLGYNGVWLYRFDQKTFYAYDANCPHILRSECSRMTLDLMQLQCGCDEAKFSLLNGSSLDHNITKIPLKPYRAVYSPSQNAVRISSF